MLSSRYVWQKPISFVARDTSQPTGADVAQVKSRKRLRVQGDDRSSEIDGSNTSLFKNQRYRCLFGGLILMGCPCRAHLFFLTRPPACQRRSCVPKPPSTCAATGSNFLERWRSFARPRCSNRKGTVMVKPSIKKPATDQTRSPQPSIAHL